MKVATLCYLKRNNQTLLLHRNQRPSDMHYMKYVGPGGKMERGERPEECASREIMEETGLKVGQLNYRGTVLFDNRGRTFNGNDNVDDFLVFVYECFNFSGEQRNPEEGELSWVDEDQITKLSMHQGDKVILEWLAKPGIFSGIQRYDKEKLVEVKVNYI